MVKNGEETEGSGSYWQVRFSGISSRYFSASLAKSKIAMPKNSMLIDSGSRAKALDASLVSAKGKRANVVITAKAINNVFMVFSLLLFTLIKATGMPEKPRKKNLFVLVG